MSRHYKKHVAFVRAAWRYLDTIDSMQRLHATLGIIKSSNSTDESQGALCGSIEKKLQLIEKYLSKIVEEPSTAQNFKYLANRFPVLSRIGEAFSLSQVMMENEEITSRQLDYLIGKLYNFDARPIYDLLQGKYSFTYRAMGTKVKRIKWITRVEDSRATSNILVDVPWIVGYANSHIHTISIHKNIENEDTFILDTPLSSERVSTYNFK